MKNKKTDDEKRTVKVVDVIEKVISYLKETAKTNDQQLDQELDLLKDLLRVSYTPEHRKNRRAKAEECIGSDPYSWTYIPNFGELEIAGYKNILVEFPDKEVVEVPLLY